MKDRDKYLKIVEWSDEDQCYVGSVTGWIGQCCHGDNEIEVFRELGKIVGEWVDIYKNDGIPLPKPTSKKYSGKFVLRTGQELHKALSHKAMREGKSLNSFVIKNLEKIIAE